MSEALLTRPAEGTAPYRAEFERRIEERRGEPGWLEERRRAALARFEEVGFPTTRQEQWRFTSVAPIARTAFRRAQQGGHAVSAREGDGVRLSLREALMREPELVRAHLGRLATAENRPFAALNTALFEDGAVVIVPPGAVVDEPLHLTHVSTNGGTPTMAHPRALIVCGKGSQAAVVETYGGGDGTYLANAVTEVVLEDGAVLDHYRVQREGKGAFHVGATAVEQGRASRYSSFAVSLGAALSRHDLDQRFAGEGAECVLNGLFLASGTQHTDTHTRIDHAVPHCASRELYKGVLDEKARGVFHGTILVRKDAQKTDALQVNKNLLLSREALVNSTPALEIFADDVKCKHGSTTGQLDALALFYLRARGLGEAEAKSLLIHGFAAELLAKVKVPALRHELEAYLQSWLPGRLEKIEEASA